MTVKWGPNLLIRTELVFPKPRFNLMAAPNAGRDDNRLDNTDEPLQMASRLKLAIHGNSDGKRIASSGTNALLRDLPRGRVGLPGWMVSRVRQWPSGDVELRRDRDGRGANAELPRRVWLSLLWQRGSAGLPRSRFGLLSRWLTRPAVPPSLTLRVVLR